LHRLQKLPGASASDPFLYDDSFLHDRVSRTDLADGSLIRLDMERGQYVGSLYRCDLTVRKVVVGTQEYVTQQMREWR
jgi:hypothetical protein